MVLHNLITINIESDEDFKQKLLEFNLKKTFFNLKE
jgi:hypothetical protein